MKSPFGRTGAIFPFGLSFFFFQGRPLSPIRVPAKAMTAYHGWTRRLLASSPPAKPRSFSSSHFFCRTLFLRLHLTPPLPDGTYYSGSRKREPSPSIQGLREWFSLPRQAKSRHFCPPPSPFPTCSRGARRAQQRHLSEQDEKATCPQRRPSPDSPFFFCVFFFLRSTLPGLLHKACNGSEG